MNDDQTRPTDDRPANETKGELATADLVKAPAASGPSAAEEAKAPAEEAASPLFAADEAGKLRARWDDVQAGFVDEPHKAVKDADSLVASTMTRLAEIFSAERSRLEGAWDRGDEVSTEDLRLALRRYRSFFSRLLSV